MIRLKFTSLLRIILLSTSLVLMVTFLMTFSDRVNQVGGMFNPTQAFVLTGLTVIPTLVWLLVGLILLWQGKKKLLKKGRTSVVLITVAFLIASPFLVAAILSDPQDGWGSLGLAIFAAIATVWFISIVIATLIVILRLPPIEPPTPDQQLFLENTA